MSNGTVLLFGLVVFGLMLTGLVLTMIEFHRITERPDRGVGIPSESRDRNKTDIAA